MTDLERIAAEQTAAAEALRANPEDDGVRRWMEDAVMEEVLIRGGKNA
jgi:hypothetical protein